jgi:hypothetical protein
MCNACIFSNLETAVTASAQLCGIEEAALGAPIVGKETRAISIRVGN